ncbi:DUF4214 domain-containing protein [Paenibacillus ginsengarvi]|uniref:DUF4214 domain-containing protein n=1 Tax=Paenibacillus ginsengarvi TaxID=400777 RepID=A0A3B0CMW7_9BACL|nr:DUF4214 domain-containing protein [Paenibacillus ginsengarvi]RKN85306.1 DUF4214 domain-containing protein [Paenibacillus ginsengarvi]
MNIAAKLHKIVLLEDREFISELYRSILDREVDEEGMKHHLRELGKGTPKHGIVIATLQADEALRLYAHSSLSGKAENGGSKVSGALRRIFDMKHEPFVHSLYRDLLCREPDQPAYAGYVDSLNRGKSKFSVFARFVSSSEFESLLALDKYAFARRALDQLILSFYK